MTDTLLYNFCSLKEDEKLAINFVNGDGVVLTKDADLYILTGGDGHLVYITTQEEITLKVPFNKICYWCILK